MIDRLHGLGLGVTLENYTAVDRLEAEFELASYLLHSGRARRVRGRVRPPARAAHGPTGPAAPPSGRATAPTWAAPWDPAPCGPTGMLERRFQRGIAVVNPPGAPARSGTLDGVYRDLDGTPRPSWRWPAVKHSS